MQKINILLIEDNVDDITFVDMFMREAFPGNHVLAKADRLAKGMELLKENSYDAVLHSRTVMEWKRWMPCLQPARESR
jgi:hypothetical protein